MNETLRRISKRFWALPEFVQHSSYFVIVGFVVGIMYAWGSPQPFIEFIETLVFFVLMGGAYALSAALVIWIKNLIAARTGSTFVGWTAALLVGIGVGAAVFYGLFYLFVLFSFKLRGLPITEFEMLDSFQLAQEMSR